MSSKKRWQKQLEVRVLLKLFKCFITLDSLAFCLRFKFLGVDKCGLVIKTRKIEEQTLDCLSLLIQMQPCYV